MALLDRIENLKKAMDVGKRAKTKKVAASVKRKLAKIEEKRKRIEKQLADASGKDRKKLENRLKNKKAQIAKGEKALAALK